MYLKNSNLPAILFLTGILWIMISCKESGIGSFVCTTELVTISLYIENDSGKPVENAALSVINAETGDPLPVCESFECNNGRMGNM